MHQLTTQLNKAVSGTFNSFRHQRQAV